MVNFVSSMDWENGDDAFPPENSGLTGDSRTEARLCAVQGLYTSLVMPRDARDVAADYETKLNKRKADKKLYRAIMAEAGEGAERFKTLLETELQEGWEWHRMDPVLRSLAWAGAAELTVNQEVPVGVIISEYLNISKAFVTPEEVSYLHKTLDSVAKKIRG